MSIKKLCETVLGRGIAPKVSSLATAFPKIKSFLSRYRREDSLEFVVLLCCLAKFYDTTREITNLYHFRFCYSDKCLHTTALVFIGRANLRMTRQVPRSAVEA